MSGVVAAGINMPRGRMGDSRSYLLSLGAWVSSHVLFRPASDHVSLMASSARYLGKKVTICDQMTIQRRMDESF